MADLQFFLHPLVSEGPNGEDDIGEHWLDGERPLRWEEEDLWRRIPGGPREEEGARISGEKDDRLGWCDEFYPDILPDALLQPGFAAVRNNPAADPDLWEPPGEIWRNTDFFQEDRDASLGEQSSLQEALKSGLPLSVVEQYDRQIFSFQLYPNIGQEIVINEDSRILPTNLEAMSEEHARKISKKGEAGGVGLISWRFWLAKKGVRGFAHYTRWMRWRRSACGRKYPGQHNLSWYLDSVRSRSNGSIGGSGLQLMISEMWGPGYTQHQRRIGSWFRRAVTGGADRILHLTIKCQHRGSDCSEGKEISRCGNCSLTARIFDMGFICTALFFRYIAVEHLRDVFEHVYPFACDGFYEQLGWLMNHLATCPMHLPLAEGEDVEQRQNVACFSKLDRRFRKLDYCLLTHAQTLTGTRYPTRSELFFLSEPNPEFFSQNFRVQDSSYIYHY